MSPENVVVVAVRAEREISKTALEWALTHVVRPGDLVTLLAVLSDYGARGGWRRRLLPWSFPRFGGGGGDSASRRHRERCQIAAVCSHMALQIDGRNEITVRIKVVGSESNGDAASSNGGRGVVATESKSVGANWIVLDKQLKQEIKHCMEELQCNIVVMRGSCAKVLRLNLGGTYEPLPPFSSACSPNCSEKFPDNRIRQLKPITIPDDVKASFHKEIREAGSSTGIGRASSIFIGEENPLFEGIHNRKLEDVGSDDAGTSDSDSSGVASPPSFHLGLDLLRDEARRESSSGFRPQPRSYPAAAFSATAHNRGVYWIPQNHIAEENAFIQSCKTHKTRPPPPSAKTLQEMFADSSRGYVIRKAGLHPDIAEDYTYGSDVREAVSLLGSSPSIPPPLCSLCRHKAPVFGKPPRRFAYRELEMATDGFSNENFVAEGAIGCVHRGVLEDGRVVAVKRLKPAGGAVIGDDEFCEEAEVLSRAQHRNVVMLVGFCVEGKRRALVYEYICNGSLDRHLYGRRKSPLDWNARIKIAVGVARGLRYLHEDCRVGFVVHKYMRPNNVLLTHDYEPLVGDFSLSRWQKELSPLVDANVAENFGYMAPEYIEHGVATEKADVYAYGVVLLEMITGRRALDAGQPKGQQFLVEWARPLLSRASDDEGRKIGVDRFLDPHLDWDQARFFSRQLRSMARAASMCLRRDPQARPGMSKVLRILEGDAVVADPGFDIDSVGTRSGRMSCPILHQDNAMAGSLSQRFAREPVMHALRDQGRWPRFR